jgi:DNA (cytosine-5)-methyltransferase 1
MEAQICAPSENFFFQTSSGPNQFNPNQFRRGKVMPSILSLCSGVGALDIAVSAFYNAEIKWFSEKDKYCNQVLSHRFPNVPDLGDLTQIDPTHLDPDIVVAGFPCQTVSIAGKRQGTDDERWVSDEIHDLIAGLKYQPKRIIFENVVALLSNKGGKTARDLFWKTSELGFSLKWAVVQANQAKAPHRRSRVFVVATNTNDTDLSRRGEHRVLECPTRQESSQRLLSILSRSRHETSLDRTHSFDFREYEPSVKLWEQELQYAAPEPFKDGKLNPRFHEWCMGFPNWITDVVDNKVARIRLSGNAVVPHQALEALHTLENEI